MAIPSLLASRTSLYMDTISRENNSLVPTVAAIVAGLALVLGLYSAFQISKVKTALAGQADKVARIDDLATQVATAQTASDKAARDVQGLGASTQSAINQIANDLAAIHEQIKHMEEAHVAKASAKGAKAGGGEPAVAGPGEYIVKPGDTGVRIAHTNGCSLTDLESVNPGVTWNHLKVGEKLKLPEKKT
jgi:LysM repeat protein